MSKNNPFDRPAGLSHSSPASAAGSRLPNRVVHAAHLRAGGAVLSFPAGCIEPDPDMGNGSAQTLQNWTDSARAIRKLARDADAFFARLHPEDVEMVQGDVTPLGVQEIEVLEVRYPAPSASP